METIQLKTEIQKLKKEQNALILAHYYTDESVQAVADYVGDSYYLSKLAKEAKEQVILFCGVKFMGESAKILSPHKKVIMADELADCPMAHMVEVETILEMRGKYEDLAVVCYINSTANIKSVSDVCVTSANAIKIVRALPQKNIFFVPDEHLGRYVAEQVPEKNIILNPGFCHVHTSITKESVMKAKESKPSAKVVVHPECPYEITVLGDYVGSTAGMIQYITESDASEFIICTELGILYELKHKNPHKKFYGVGHRQFCPNMKRISLEKIRIALESQSPQVELEEAVVEEAKIALEAMHNLAQ
ncbi:MAG: quinolinate synthase NadA [Cellulosilyticaceae bacterium]